MPDDIDKAQAADEANTQDAIERQRVRSALDGMKHRLQAIGECLNPHCAEPFPAKDNLRLYCGPRCEAEHRRINR